MTPPWDDEEDGDEPWEIEFPLFQRATTKKQ